MKKKMRNIFAFIFQAIFAASLYRDYAYDGKSSQFRKVYRKFLTHHDEIQNWYLVSINLYSPKEQQ